MLKGKNVQQMDASNFTPSVNDWSLKSLNMERVNQIERRLI